MQLFIYTICYAVDKLLEHELGSQGCLGKANQYFTTSHSLTRITNKDCKIALGHCIGWVSLKIKIRILLQITGIQYTSDSLS